MSSDEDKKGKRNNPWGNVEQMGGSRRHSSGKGQRGGGYNGGGSGGEPPELEDLLRNARRNFKEVMPGGMRGGSIFVLSFLALIALWAASGFYIVNPGENAVIQRFGAWDRTQVEPGLGYHLPVPIESRAIVNVEEIQNLTIGFTQSYNRANASTQKRSVPDEALMLTADRNIVDLHFIIQWNIKSAEDYLFKIQAQESTIKKIAESAIREVVGQTGMFPIITTGRATVASRTQEIIQKNLDAYQSGVNITQVLIDKAEVHPEVQGAFQDVQSAKQDAEDVQNRAEAYREDILPKARGRAIELLQQAEAYKDSVIAKSTGDAGRFNSVYQAYLNGKDVTKERLYIEAMEEVFLNADKIILDKDGGGVMPYLPLKELGTSKGR